jgi:hypothetical protein
VTAARTTNSATARAPLALIAHPPRRSRRQPRGRTPP